MKPLIIANWKMNPASQKEAKRLFDAVKKVGKSKNVQVVICPPFLYLPLLKGITLGAQNVFFEDKGAFTGEISSLQLKDAGVEYVIIGHSERRRYFSETNDQINKKIKKVLEADMKSILCVGETVEEKDRKQDILETQITKALAGVSNVKSQMSKVVIAYEPVWAIGTGNNCSVDETMSSVVLIRKIISQLYSREVANAVKVIYGGSVNSSNAAVYITSAGANGLLIGSNSLNSDDFVKIVKSIN